MRAAAPAAEPVSRISPVAEDTTTTSAYLYEDPAGGFEVRFPVVPDVTSPGGGLTSTYRASGRDGSGHAYLAQVKPLGHRPASIEAFFTGVRDAMSRAMKLAVVHDEAMPLGRHPGRMFILRGEEQGRVMELMVRKVFVDGTDYYLSVAYLGRDGLDREKGRAFVASLGVAPDDDARMARGVTPVAR